MRIAIAVSLISAVAFASVPKQLNMPVGQTTTLSMSAPVSSVVVDDASLIGVTRQGRRVVLVAQKSGTTDITVKTADGETKLHVYVAADKYGMP